MERALDLLEQIGDVVQVEPRPQAPEVARFDLEGLTWGRGGGAGETAPEGVVDHVAEHPARPPGQGLQRAGNVFVEGDGRAHILMLRNEHQDVKARSGRPDTRSGAIDLSWLRCLQQESVCSGIS